MKATPSLPGFDHSSLSMLLAAARRSVKHAVAPLLEPLDLTPHQAWMILLIRETGPLSLTELATRMWLDHPTASRLVHSLEERQLLAVNQDPNHGRRILIGIHEEGAAFIETLFMASETFRERMERGLSDEDKDVFRRTLGQLLHNISGMNAELPKRKSGIKGKDLELD